MPCGGDERDFIESRDSFYMATITENGWPYLQHRGGAKGFLRVTGPNELMFADHGGNRQMISVGSLAVNDRVSLFLMDYPARERLKILGHAEGARCPRASRSRREDRAARRPRGEGRAHLCHRRSVL